MAELSRKLQKLLELFYSEKITAEFFADEERRLTETIRSLSEELEGQVTEASRSTGLEARFEEVAAILTQLEVEQLWLAATEKEQRVLIEELLEGVAIFPGSPRGHRRRRTPAERPALGGRAQGVADCWCRRGDLNPHALAGTSPSSWRVCLFRHSDVGDRR
jgi:hypothetical protein